MKQIRKQIDEIDKAIVKLLGKRMKLALKLGKIKKKEGLPIQDKKREEEILMEFEKLAEKAGLDHKYIKKLYKEIFKESRRIQKAK